MITVIYFWRIPKRLIPFAITRIALDRRVLKKNNSISFFKLLGCGHGKSFTPMDADAQRWGLLICIDEKTLAEFNESLIIRRWRDKSVSEFRAILHPISSHGQWSGKSPFGNFDRASSTHETVSDESQVVAITRARIAWLKYPRFLRSIPPVRADLQANPGMISALGIGEAPIGLQGTFSLWESESALREFAFKGRAHADAISATKEFGWYKEELFARFRVQEIRGSL